MDLSVLKTLEYPNVWFTNKGHSDRFGGLNNWFKAKNNSQIKGAFSSIVSTSEKIKRAKSAFENAFKKGFYETDIINSLNKRGFVAVNQFNFGIYNIDISIHELPIFIEIQTSSLHLLRKPKRSFLL